MDYNKVILKAKQKDEKMIEKIISDNMGLIIFICKQLKINHIYLEDAIQEGIIGILKAIEKFNFEKNTKFSTYATLWIKNEIIREITLKQRAIRIPVHANEKWMKDKNKEIPPHLLTPKSLSFKKYINGEEYTLESSIEDESFLDPKVESLLALESEKVLNLISKIDLKARKILVYKTGYDFSFSEIAKKLSISKENARLTFNKTLIEIKKLIEKE